MGFLISLLFTFVVAPLGSDYQTQGVVTPGDPDTTPIIVEIAPEPGDPDTTPIIPE